MAIIHGAEPHRSKVFQANYRFRCACCEIWFEAGTPARYIEDQELVNANEGHDETDGFAYDPGESRLGKQKIEVMPRGKSPKDRCDKCFMVHASLQVECE